MKTILSARMNTRHDMQTCAYTKAEEAMLCLMLAKSKGFTHPGRLRLLVMESCVREDITTRVCACETIIHSMCVASS